MPSSPRPDDGDEQGFRIYGVVGRLDATEPELSLRVGVYGHFAPADWPQVFDGPQPGVRLAGDDANLTEKEVIECLTAWTTSSCWTTPG